MEDSIHEWFCITHISIIITNHIQFHFILQNQNKPNNLIIYSTSKANKTSWWVWEIQMGQSIDVPLRLLIEKNLGRQSTNLHCLWDLSKCRVTLIGTRDVHPHLRHFSIMALHGMSMDTRVISVPSHAIPVFPAAWEATPRRLPDVLLGDASCLTRHACDDVGDANSPTIPFSARFAFQASFAATLFAEERIRFLKLPL